MVLGDGRKRGLQLLGSVGTHPKEFQPELASGSLGGGTPVVVGYGLGLNGCLLSRRRPERCTWFAAGEWLVSSELGARDDRLLVTTLTALI